MYTYSQLEELHGKSSSPFYILCSDKLEQNYQRMHAAFATRYPTVIMAYSYKTNYLPYLCRCLHDLGAFAEVVSRLEYDLALKIGVDPTRVIFNGPLKSEGDVELALDNGSLVNIDSFSELESVTSYAERHPWQEVKVGLRVNLDLSKGGMSPLQDGYEVSRFGFCIEGGSFQTAITKLREMPNIAVVGLHGHFSTNRSLAVYETITRQLCRLAKRYIADELEYIDIGGGMYGHLPESFGLSDVPTYDDYATAICGVMQEEITVAGQAPALILEPGISLVADAFDFACRVIDIRENRGRRFVLVDGSVHNVKPTMHRFELPAYLVAAAEKQQPRTVYQVVGYTCMEKDYLLMDFAGPCPSRGDFIVFGHVGAYTIVLSPPFIRARPPIFAKRDDTFLLVRRGESLREFCSENLYLFPPAP